MKLARDVALGQRMFFRKNRKYVYPPLKAEAALTSKMGGLPKKFSYPIHFCGKTSINSFYISKEAVNYEFPCHFRISFRLHKIKSGYLAFVHEKYHRFQKPAHFFLLLLFSPSSGLFTGLLFLLHT